MKSPNTPTKGASEIKSRYGQQFLNTLRAGMAEHNAVLKAKYPNQYKLRQKLAKRKPSGQK